MFRESGVESVTPIFVMALLFRKSSGRCARHSMSPSHATQVMVAVEVATRAPAGHEVRAVTDAEAWATRSSAVLVKRSCGTGFGWMRES